MANWQNSDRRQRLPPDWRLLRRKVAMRANWRCQGIIDGSRCGKPGSHCDHILRGDDHSMANLQWLCPDCHNSKSGREGAEARPRLARPAEAHPGLKAAAGSSVVFRPAGR
ncbi:MAG: HNH endonuclease signature motif containing protein [Mycobacterium sp.]